MTTLRVLNVRTTRAVNADWAFLTFWTLSFGWNGWFHNWFFMLGVTVMWGATAYDLWRRPNIVTSYLRLLGLALFLTDLVLDL